MFLDDKKHDYFQGGPRVNIVREYFLCDSCESKDFRLIYNFGLRFHGVNFSDDLIYDELVEEMYQCIQCEKTFTKKEMEAGLIEIKRRHKNR